MKRELAAVVAGASSMFVVRTVYADWVSQRDPTPRQYTVFTGCDTCDTPDSVTMSALNGGANVWNNIFSSQGWGSGWVTPGGDDLKVMFPWNRSWQDQWGYHTMQPGSECESYIDAAGKVLVCDPGLMFSQTQAAQELEFAHEFGHTMAGISDDTTVDNTLMSHWDYWNSNWDYGEFFTGEDYYEFEAAPFYFSYS